MTDITGATLYTKVRANTITAFGGDPEDAEKDDPITDDVYIKALCNAIADEVNAWIDTVYATHTHAGSPTAPSGIVSPTGVPTP